MVPPCQRFTTSAYKLCNFERLRSPKYTPSEREPGMAAPFIRLLAKIRGYGRFSSPLRSSDEFGFHHSSNYSLKSGVTGDFHRPYEGRGGGTRVYPKLSFSPWETLWHRSRKVSWLMVATEEGSCTGPVAMVPFSPGRVPPAREAAHRSRAYRAA